MVIGRIGGLSAEGKSIVYDMDSESVQEIAIPVLPIGTRVEQDAKGDWRVVVGDNISPESARRLIQSELFYYQTRHILPYETYRYVLQLFPTNCATKFEKNPYFLSDLHKEGSEAPLCPFPVIDRGVVLDSFQKRVLEMSYAMQYVLEQNRNQGHTWMSYSEFSKRVKSLLKKNGHPLLRGSVAAYLSYYSNLFYYQNQKVALLSDYEAEESIYREVKKAALTPPPFPGYRHERCDFLSDKQNSAVEGVIAKGGHISILTGGPGTGKTTVLKTIVREITEQFPDIRIQMLSPTGRAAKRIKEVMEDTDISISTIHRFLGFGHRLSKRERDVIAHTDLIFIDESSMMDLYIFKRLLMLANLEKTKIVLVGDVDQLPSVGAGNVLSDLIALGVHTEYLTENFRSNGSIIGNSIAINEGNIALKEDEQFRIVEVPSRLLNIVSGLSDQTDIVLTPYRVEESERSSKRTGSSNVINKISQTRKFGHVSGFVVGDNVIMDKTNYKQGYFNGEMGVVLAKHPNGDYVVGFGDRELVIKQPKDMSLAYAVTNHKSQGSEYDNVGLCVPAFESFYSKKMFYTAVTRAKDTVTIWGSKEDLRKIILNHTDENRRTFLSAFPKLAG